jgi:hypothetical protein
MSNSFAFQLNQLLGNYDNQYRILEQAFNQLPH